MTQQTVAADLDLLICGNRRTVVNERMITYGDMGPLVSDDFDRNNVPHQANAIPKFYVPVSPEMNPSIKSYRQRYLSFASSTKLRVEKSRS
jgi:hypothetical protein